MNEILNGRRFQINKTFQMKVAFSKTYFFREPQ